MFLYFYIFIFYIPPLFFRVLFSNVEVKLYVSINILLMTHLFIIILLTNAQSSKT
jgi:hypothetical protein